MEVRCDPATDRVAGVDAVCGDSAPSRGHPLVCDPVNAACRLPCASDDDCIDAGLLAFICDLRPGRDTCCNFEELGIDGDASHGMCIVVSDTDRSPPRRRCGE